MKTNSLQREDFDSFLMRDYLKFLRTEGNFIQVGMGKRLKPGIKYQFSDCKNRNPDQVADVIWKIAIIKHLTHHTYN